ncbi:probable vesicular glutamate transporter eat-4 [Acyrthosiphon pisum]|uniref:Uncharacterized protein n=1 Tax=Acyrthosiphon pisum TaxID=7029 RepID=A0A8R2AB96_ACYPI|nr:probable vesicular glutamate transporter eat-4 [Acyrthosiphon pisum]|eukprot:XP_003248371.1 PREDICTED: probable vesicular glutamate transporter eat-4 [Acyrthosiphon pisum]
MMSLEGNVISRWDPPSYLQLPEQPSSRFMDRLIHLKTTYWNRGYAIFLLGFIGLTITSLQWTVYYRFIEFMEKQNKIDSSHYGYMSYNMYGYSLGLIPGGILGTVYPAHNILGIFIAVSSIGHLLHFMSISYLNTLTHCIFQFFIGTTMAVVDMSLYRVWTYWVPLNKQSIRHVPIVLYVMIFDGGYIHDTIDNVHDKHSSSMLTLFIGLIGLAWYVLWLYVINGNYSFRNLKNPDCILFGGTNNSRYSFEAYGVSLTRSIVSEIPWKSICTSKPFLAIVLLYVFDVRLHYSFGSVGDDTFEWTMRHYTIVLMLLFVVLVELVPEITVSISTANVRKFWSCSYFGSMGIVFILEAILGNTIRTNKTCQYFFNEMHYLYSFGFYVNILDIAPKYASLLASLLLSIHYNSDFLWVNVINRILSYVNLNEVETDILMTIICFTLAVLYAIFASAEPHHGQMNRWKKINKIWLKMTINYNNLICTM